MKRRLAQWLRREANRLDPPPLVTCSSGNAHFTITYDTTPSGLFRPHATPPYPYSLTWPVQS